MFIQVLSGILLSTRLVVSADTAFDSIEYMMETLKGGSIIRFFHAGSCSMVFAVILFHIGKGL
jgi:quinol-cytochrome oxidoreductase complex cytochrome b subunit